MGSKQAAALVLSVILAVVAFAGCGGQAASSVPAASSLPQESSLPLASAPAEQASSAAVSGAGAWALDINTVTLDGAAVTSMDFEQNTLTVLNIWATWCPPCVGELPHLQAMNEKFREQGVEIVGVLQDGVTPTGEVDAAVVESAQKLLEDAKADYQIILPDAAITETFISEMQYFPTTYFLDAGGNVVETVVGANSAEEWEAIIHEVLEKV